MNTQHTQDQQPLLSEETASPSLDNSLEAAFVHPPDEARPGVYWYFMDGNRTREGMTRDLEAMKAAGMGHAIYLEVDVGVPRGPIDFLSKPWRELFVHAVREAERLGMEIILGSGPGWAGSGGPWVKPEQSMQHLTGQPVIVEGPAPFTGALPVAPPHRPFFGEVPEELKEAWQTYYRDVAVLAFPAGPEPGVEDIEEKALVYRAPYSSQPGVKPFLEVLADYPADPPGAVIDAGQILDLTDRLRPDGALDWQIPEGRWIVLRLVSRNNGASSRPAPLPGVGFECDKFDAAALDAHFEAYLEPLLQDTAPLKPGCGLTTLHIDSWEMGAQNWTPAFRDEFIKRRGYDPKPYYPVWLGYLVGSGEQSERFLWDLRLTSQELILENHSGRLKELGRRYGLIFSNEPYDMNPACDFDLGAVADLPMAEFWSSTFDTTYSCHEATSIAHVMGRPVVGAESFTAGPPADFTACPWRLKNQTDWAFATGINRLTFHTFAHKPDDALPGMTMGPYGVHWDRGQPWWPMVGDYHRYIARCSYLLRQGVSVADVLYLLPEGAPNVFEPPHSALAGTREMPDRRGYNFDCCSAPVLVRDASVRDGRVVFPGGAAYRLLVLPNVETMTPELLLKLKELIAAGARVVGNPPRKSPSLVNYPACDAEVAQIDAELWGDSAPPSGVVVRAYGQGALYSGDAVYAGETGRYPHYELTARLLREAGVTEDFVSDGPLRYTHRHLPDREIYFVSNRSDEAVDTAAVFRSDRPVIELWDPRTGSIRPLLEACRMDCTTRVPLRFEPYESYFVVFADSASSHAGKACSVNFDVLSTVQSLNGPWDVEFDPSLGGLERVQFDSLCDWTERSEPEIRYYSGAAVYRLTFDLQQPERLSLHSCVYLDLGRVEVIARVRLNGQDCGVAWTAPWRVDVSRALKPFGNELEIEVANLWPNRLIGDAVNPDHPIARTNHRPFQATDPLLPSGLLGPVRLLS